MLFLGPSWSQLRTALMRHTSSSSGRNKPFFFFYDTPMNLSGSHSQEHETLWAGRLSRGVLDQQKNLKEENKCSRHFLKLFSSRLGFSRTSINYNQTETKAGWNFSILISSSRCHTGRCPQTSSRWYSTAQPTAQAWITSGKTHSHY